MSMVISGQSLMYQPRGRKLPRARGVIHPSRRVTLGFIDPITGAAGTWAAGKFTDWATGWAKDLFGPTKEFKKRQAVRDTYYAKLREVGDVVIPTVDPRLREVIKKDLDYLYEACSKRCGYPDDIERLKTYGAKWAKLEADLNRRDTAQDPIYKPGGGKKPPTSGTITVKPGVTKKATGEIDIAGFKVPTWVAAGAGVLVIYKLLKS